MNMADVIVATAKRWDKEVEKRKVVLKVRLYLLD